MVGVSSVWLIGPTDTRTATARVLHSSYFYAGQFLSDEPFVVRGALADRSWPICLVSSPCRGCSTEFLLLRALMPSISPIFSLLSFPLLEKGVNERTILGAQDLATSLSASGSAVRARQSSWTATAKAVTLIPRRRHPRKRV